MSKNRFFKISTEGISAFPFFLDTRNFSLPWKFSSWTFKLRCGTWNSAWCKEFHYFHALENSLLPDWAWNFDFDRGNSSFPCSSLIPWLGHLPLDLGNDSALVRNFVILKLSMTTEFWRPSTFLRHKSHLVMEFWTFLDFPYLGQISSVFNPEHGIHFAWWNSSFPCLNHSDISFINQCVDPSIP